MNSHTVIRIEISPCYFVSSFDKNVHGSDHRTDQGAQINDRLKLLLHDRHQKRFQLWHLHRVDLLLDDPLDIDCVTDMPTPDAWLAPWMPEDEVEWVA